MISVAVTQDTCPLLEPDDLFSFWRDIDGQWVEEPNQRRGGTSGVKKVVVKGRGTFFIKIQCNHLYRTLRYPLGRPTILREAEAIEACHRLGIRAPQIVYCGAQKTYGMWQAVLVTQELEGFVSFQQWLTAKPTPTDPGETRALIIQQLAYTLALFHRAGWQHRALYPKHIFLRISQADKTPNAEIALIDLEKSHKKLVYASASAHDLRQLRKYFLSFSDSDWVLFDNHYQKHLE